MQGPTPAEITATRSWLAKKGVQVETPTPLLAVRIGGQFTSRMRVAFFLLPLLSGPAMFGLLFLRSALDGVWRELADGLPTAVLSVVMFGGVWIATRLVDRDIVRRLPREAVGPRRSLSLLGPWYLAAAAITFGGGVALLVAILLTTSARGYALSELGLITLYAVWFACFLAIALNTRVVAEDAGSRAVDDALWVRSLYLGAPAIYAWLMLISLPFLDGPPPEFAAPTYIYIALAIGTQVIGGVVHWKRYRKLPPGEYGVPAVAGSGLP